MPTKTVVVGSAVGLHARPAAIISEAAGELDAEVTLATPGGDPVDASSALMIMTLGAGNGDSVEVSSDDQEACVAVLDRGIGIGDADPDQLFTAFYRTEAAKMRTAGLGIGLAVCQRIVDSLGGRIWARPREGGGTEAGFALPLAVVSPD